jgi:hypothetical protein
MSVRRRRLVFWAGGLLLPIAAKFGLKTRNLFSETIDLRETFPQVLVPLLINAAITHAAIAKRRFCTLQLELAVKLYVGGEVKSGTRIRRCFGQEKSRPKAAFRSIV